MKSTTRSPVSVGRAVDWDFAATVGAKLTRSGPAVTDYTQRQAIDQLAEFSRRAELPVRDVTGLNEGGVIPEARIVDRAQWIRAATRSMRVMMGGADGDKDESSRGRTQFITSRITGVQTGGVLAFLSQGILGQYDPFGPGGGELLLVYPNVIAVERNLRVQPADFRLWVCLHEVTHRVQFRANPWLADHMSQALGVLTAEAGDDVTEMVGRLAEFVRARRDGNEAASEPNSSGMVGLLRAMQGEPQRRALDQLLVLLIGIGAWLLISTDPVLGLLALSFVPFAAWRSSVTQLTLRRTWLQLQERLGVLSQVMEENLAGIRVVRAFAASDFEMAKFDKASDDALALSYSRIDTRVRSSAVMTLAFFAAMGLVLLVGGQQVAAGEMTVGSLATFLTFMTLLQLPVRQLGLMVNAFARASTTGARLFTLLDMEVEIDDAPGATDLKVSEGTLRLENVGFGYTGADPAVSGISFEARRGETVGIVGPPGSGKSTLMHLIPRYYDVDEGAITIDGQDIRNATLSSVRRSVAVVQQDDFLFTTTIENNVAYGDPFASDEQIRDATASAQLHDYVDGLPKRYGTVVGERGVSLSGGQRQRLSIARTLMLEPDVLIFDDSTAAIDAGTESRIRNALRAYAEDRVTLIVAHRLGSLKHADRILFLDKGRIVEQGTHEELLLLNGRYRALHDLQTRPDADISESNP